MKKNLMWGALMVIAFASCTQEDVLNNEAGQNTLRASMEEGVAKSRVGFTNQSAEFFWTKNDKIGVTTTSSQTFQGMTLEGEGGEATGTFSGTMSAAASGYAVYPYGASGRHSVSNNVLTYTLPATYEYTTLDTEYAKSDGNSHNAPMWGSISNGSVNFKHLGGVIAFSVGNLPESTSNMRFVLTATNQISGSFSATLTATEPKIETTTTNVAEEDKKVTITFSTAAGQSSGYFYVPVPTGELGNLSLVILNDEDEVATGAWDNITIARKDIRRATIGNQSIIGSNGEIKQVTSVSEVSNALTTTENNLTVQVSAEVTGTENTIEIPATLETATTTFSFASVADGAKITIKDANDGSYDGKIIIEIPENETLPEVEANIPNGEVYIKQGTVTTLVTSAADNTTIIGANATIGTLTVAKGNVRIEDGGKVTKIERDSENSATVYVVYESATAPTIETGEGVVLMSAAEYDLITKFKQGGTQTITLEGDVELTQPLTLTEGNITLNLNGKTITASQSDAIVVTNDAQLTITGNGIVQVEKGANGCAVWAHHDGQVTIENGTFSTNDDADGDRCDCIYAGSTADMSAGTITINGGTFKYDGENAEGHKFLLNKKDNTQSTITVNGGVFHKFNPAISYGEPNAPVDFVAETSIVVETADNVFEVLPSENDMVTLSKDITLYSPIEVNKGNITLNLNGKTITASKSDAIVVTKTAQLTITGNGIVQVQKGANGCAVWAHHGGQVTIENGTFSTNDDADGDRCDCIYAGSTADMSAGTITINGGTFKYDGENAEGHKFLLNKKDNTESSISVTGGIFYRFDPAISYGEPNAPVNFVAEGYQSNESDENGVKVYTVVSKEAE